MGRRQNVLQAQGLEEGACNLKANVSLLENDPVPYIHVEGWFSFLFFLKFLAAAKAVDQVYSWYGMLVGEGSAGESHFKDTISFNPPKPSPVLPPSSLPTRGGAETLTPSAPLLTDITHVLEGSMGRKHLSVRVKDPSLLKVI